MDIWGDNRGQSIQIGAVLLFGLLIVALSSYQAFVVPGQNTEIEYQHNAEVQEQLGTVRNQIVAATSQPQPRPVGLELGTEYPRRVFALNPGPASGTLRTEWTTDPSVAVAVENARSRGETADFWSGARRSLRTVRLVYTPDYNLYRQAPTTVYANSVLYNRYGSRNRTVTGQQLIDDRRISLVTLNGSLQTTRAGTMVVDPTYLSRSSTTVPVTTNTSGLRYEFYEAEYDSVTTMPAYDESNLVRTGVTSNFDVPEDNDENDFGYIFNGTIEVPSAGTYTFYTTSDDGSVLHVDGTEVVNNDGQHAPATESGSITLSEGTHEIGLAFFEDNGQNELTVEWEGPNFSRQDVPDSVLSNTEGRSAEQIELTIPTTLRNETWRTLLEEQFASNGGYVQSMDVSGTEPPYEYYEADYSSEFDMPEFDESNLVTTGQTDNFDIKELKERDDGYAFRFNKRIDVPSAGSYTFYTTSDDGSRLYIDGERVVNNDGQHANVTESRSTFLEAGTHDITVTMFEDDGAAGLTVEWDGPGFPREEIPNAALSDREGVGELALALTGGETYQLRMARVGVGSRTADPGAAYVTPVAGVNESVREGGETTVVVEVRDRYNNPVSGVLVNASTDRSDSAVQPRIDTTDQNGQLRLTYEAPENIDTRPRSDSVDVSLVVDPASAPGFDAETSLNATVPLTVRNTDGSGLSGGGGGGGSGGPYAIQWQNASSTGDNPDANLTNCDTSDCVWDVSSSQDATLTLRANTTPSVQGTTLDYAIGDTTIGTIRPGEAETDSTGEATTELRARANGTVATYVAQSGSSDRYNVTIQNVTRLGVVYETDATAIPYPPSSSSNTSRLDFNLTNTRDQSIDIYAVTVNSSSAGSQIEDRSDGDNNEIELDSNDNGIPDGNLEVSSGVYQIGNRVQLDNSETVGAADPTGQGDTTHVQFNEFQDASGNSVSMVGERIEFTVHYMVNGERAADTFDIKTIQRGG